MKTEKDFEQAIASATGNSLPIEVDAGKKTFELAKQMAKDFAIWLGKNRWMYADVMNGEHEYYNEVTGKYVALSKLFSEYSPSSNKIN